MPKIVNSKAARIISCLFVALFLNSLVVGQKTDISWKSGEFQIHVFDVGQADSQLIVSPSGKTLLIDAGESNWNSKKLAGRVANKLREVMGADFSHLDYVVSTHLHLDHIGYAEKGGLWALIEKYHFTIGKLVDRNSAEWVDFDEDDEFDPPEELYWNNVGTVSSTATKWLTYVLDPANTSKLHREIARKGDKAQIDLGNPVTVEIVECDALGVTMEDGITPVGGDHRNQKGLPSENDYSITLKISYKQLDYVTGGDTDGEYEKSKYGYSYNNIESVIAPVIGEIEILHVNHHGSSHSTNQVYLDSLKPFVSIISCGKNKYGHPAQETLDRLLSIGSLYLTEKGDTERAYKNSIVVGGDIVIKSSDGIVFAVNGASFSTK